MDTSAVSFCSATKSLSSGGRMRRTACGITTWRSVCHCESPSERAAAVWLQWMLSSPDRYTSATYAPYTSDEREHAEPEQLRVAGHVRRERLDAGERKPEADQVDDDDRGDAAEHVGVDDGERAQRHERAAGQLAHHGDDERPHEHDHLGDEEQLDVPPEAAEQRGAARPDQVPVEHHRADETVVGGEEERAERERSRRRARSRSRRGGRRRHLRPRCARRGSARRRRGGARGGCARWRALRTRERSSAATREDDLDRECDLRAGRADHERVVERAQSGPRDCGEGDRDDLGDDRACDAPV